MKRRGEERRGEERRGEERREEERREEHHGNKDGLERQRERERERESREKDRMVGSHGRWLSHPRLGSARWRGAIAEVVQRRWLEAEVSAVVVEEWI